MQLLLSNFGGLFVMSSLLATSSDGTGIAYGGRVGGRGGGGLVKSSLGSLLVIIKYLADI